MENLKLNLITSFFGFGVEDLFQKKFIFETSTQQVFIKMDIYFLCKLFLYTVLRIFFSEIEVIGRENIPTTGSLIFVGKTYFF